jgi:hypothetical protein
LPQLQAAREFLTESGLEIVALVPAGQRIRRLAPNETCTILGAVGAESCHAREMVQEVGRVLLPQCTGLTRIGISF